MPSRKILLVEDDDDHAALFQRAAKKNEAIEVTRAARGEEALELLRAGGHFDLMVLDLNMPGIRGFEVLSQVRSNDATRRLPTVVMSTSSEASDTALAYELTANSYLVKPADWGEYRAMVSQMAEYWLDLNVPAAF